MKQLILEYKTKHIEGFTVSELQQLKKQFPINESKFAEFMKGKIARFRNEERIYFRKDISEAFEFAKV
mgnify:CR=1 FL=1